MVLIFLISLVIYIIATIMIYHNLYNYNKSEKIKIIVIGYITTFILTLILCNISSRGINTNSSYLSIIKNTSILLFSPINLIISLPYVCNSINKYKEERINIEQLKMKLVIFAILLIILLIFEVGYIKDFQTGLLKSVEIKKSI